MESTANADNFGESFSTDSNTAAEQGIFSKLHLAADEGDCQRIQLLVEEGFHLEAKNGRGRTPLLQAAYKGHVDAFDLLVRLRADFNAVDRAERNSTHLAAEEGHLEILKRIKEYVDRHNRQNNNERAPEVLGSSNEDVGTFLNFTSEYNINAKDKFSYTALNLAHENWHAECVNFLKSCGADPKEEGYTTKLHYAAHDGVCEQINFLVEKEFDLEARDGYKRTPLQRAALQGHVEAFALLLDLGANFEAQDEYGRYSQHLAAKKDHSLLLTWIIRQKGIDVLNSRDYYGRSPLHVAALTGSNRVLELIISSGFNINCQDSWGRTPLHLACKEGRENTAELLERLGADKKLQDINGKTPSYMARSRSRFNREWLQMR